MREVGAPTALFRVPGQVPGGTPSRDLSRAVRLRAPLLTAGAVGVATLAVHLRDPHVAGSWGFCPWLALTGHYCPGCGSLRAVHDLTNLDLAGAAGSNLLLVASIPLLVLLWVRWTRRAWAPRTSGPSGPTAHSRTRDAALIAGSALVMIAFTVLRNLPAGSWLAP